MKVQEIILRATDNQIKWLKAGENSAGDSEAATQANRAVDGLLSDVAW